MKKFLVLALVLAVASLASATVTLGVDKTLVNPGELVTITVSSDTTLDYAKYLDITDIDGGLGTINLPVVISPNAGANASVGAENINDILLTAADYSSHTNPGVHFTITVTAGTSGSFNVALISADDPYPVEMSQVVTVPEPATIALLCIGGMLLRKKK